MKGGPVCGSERDITGKKYVLLALFHYWLGFLIRGQGAKQRCLLIKQGNFSSCYGAKLQLYIMQLSLSLTHSLPLSLFPLFLQLLHSLPLSLCLSLSLSLSGRTLHVMLISMLPALPSRKIERRVRGSSWNGRQQPHLQIMSSHCVIEWMWNDGRRSRRGYSSYWVKTFFISKSYRTFWHV